MHKVARTEKDLFIAYLLIGAMFFAMRSCEYLRTSFDYESKRTKILCLRNFQFKRRGRLLSVVNDDLEAAELVMITFEFQKNEWRNQTVHMYATKDPILNPVIAWARVIKTIISSVPDYSMNTQVCFFYDCKTKKASMITSSIVGRRLKAAVKVIGVGSLGFTEDDISLHSVRSGGAMAMFLSGVRAIIIQRVGRWSSLAFLEYIREQVDSFTRGVSDKMLEFEEFHTLNAKEGNLDVDEGKYDPQSKGDGDIKIPYSLHWSDNVIQDDTLETAGYADLADM